MITKLLNVWKNIGVWEKAIELVVCITMDDFNRVTATVLE